MTAQTMTPEAIQSLRAELIAWEMREARIYGEPMSRAAAERKVDAGLLVAMKAASR